MRDWRDYQVSIPPGESGLWSVQRFEVPAAMEQVYRDLRRRLESKGDIGFLEPILRDPEPERHIVAGQYTKLTVRDENYLQQCVMSDTQPEIEEHFPLFERAHGRVMIHGLGLGMCALACAHMPQVESVHVLERSVDVLKLVASHVRHPKITIERADALRWLPSRRDRWECVWSDIWTYICDRNLPEMRALGGMYRRHCDWHGYGLAADFPTEPVSFSSIVAAVRSKEIEDARRVDESTKEELGL